MVSVSSDFAPPLKLIAPFFAVGALAYVGVLIIMFAFSSNFDTNSHNWIGILHLYLLGYVMMIIVGALAQLLPVVLEKGHCCVGFYPIIFSLVTAGTVIMVAGFWFFPSLVSYGGMLVVSAFTIFSVELFLTAKKEIFRSMSTKTMGFASLFLVLGTSIGWVMSASWNGVFMIDAKTFLIPHIISVVGGGIILIIFGIAQILLPMFGLSHGFDQRFASYAYKIALFGIVITIIGLLYTDKLTIFGVGLVVISIAFHLIQIILILKKRARLELDIWFRSVVSAYLFLILSLVILIVGLSQEKVDWKLFQWFFGVGFLSFLINAHLYKIIPFLVWFERFSPLVGKQKIPMLHQMLPKRAADMQWIYSLSGILMGAAGLMSHSDSLWHGGLTFMVVGGLFLVRNVFWMLRFQ